MKSFILNKYGISYLTACIVNDDLLMSVNVLQVKGQHNINIQIYNFIKKQKNHKTKTRQYHKDAVYY